MPRSEIKKIKLTMNSYSKIKFPWNMICYLDQIWCKPMWKRAKNWRLFMHFPLFEFHSVVHFWLIYDEMHISDKYISTFAFSLAHYRKWIHLPNIIRSIIRNNWTNSLFDFHILFYFQFCSYMFEFWMIYDWMSNGKCIRTIYYSRKMRNFCRRSLKKMTFYFR